MSNEQETHVWVGPADRRQRWTIEGQTVYYEWIKQDYEQGRKNIHDVYTEWLEGWITSEQYRTIVPDLQEGEEIA